MIIKIECFFDSIYFSLQYIHLKFYATETLFHFMKRIFHNYPYTNKSRVLSRGETKLKKILGFAIVLLFLFGTFCITFAADDINGSAPNSGDGIPDGSGFEDVVAVADEDSGNGPAPYAGDCVPDGSGFEQPRRINDEVPGKGPAPNSGDGIPDGSGF